LSLSKTIINSETLQFALNFFHSVDGKDIG